MFQLIVAVISIVLVAALAIASIYYGGEAFNKSSLKANVTTLVNGGQQIAGAQALYRTDVATSATDIAELLSFNGEQYLSAIPGVSKLATAGWTLESGVLASVTLDADKVTEICQEAAKQSNQVYVALSTTDVPAPAGQFGCFGTAAAPKFGFKL